MKTQPPKIIELSTDEVEELLQRVEAGRLNAEDCATIKALVESYAYLTHLLEQKGTTLDRLRKILFGPTSEKTRDVIPSTSGDAPVAGSNREIAGAQTDGTESGVNATVPTDATAATTNGDASAPKAGPESQPAAPPPGHGRNGADAYAGAEKICVDHASLKPGDSCPRCQQGIVYKMAQPGTLIRITLDTACQGCRPRSMNSKGSAATCAAKSSPPNRPPAWATTSTTPRRPA